MLDNPQIKIALLTSFLWISSIPLVSSKEIPEPYTEALIKTAPASLLDGTAGVSVIYKKAYLSYTTVFRAHEFKGQAGQTVYGNINLGYSFA
ncbi:MAG: DUF2219 family protein [Gammaproteobacteria bacterium]|nr:DUF2219 family protein [Gammaproteobacteria bacterium]